MQHRIPAPRPSSPRLTTVVTTTAETTLVGVTGEIDAATTEQLSARLAEELALDPPALIVDLGGVVFCSARGLAVLLGTSTDAHAAGIPCAIVARHPAVLRPVRALRLERVLQVHASVADAQEWLAILPRLTGRTRSRTLPAG